MGIWGGWRLEECGKNMWFLSVSCWIRNTKCLGLLHLCTTRQSSLRWRGWRRSLAVGCTFGCTSGDVIRPKRWHILLLFVGIWMISAFSRLVKLSTVITVIVPDRNVNSRGVFYSSLNLPFVIGTIALQRICSALTLGLWRLQQGIFNSPLKRWKYLNSFYANIPLIITVWVVSSNLLLANAGNILESTSQKKSLTFSTASSISILHHLRWKKQLYIMGSIITLNYCSNRISKCAICPGYRGFNQWQLDWDGVQADYESGVLSPVSPAEAVVTVDPYLVYDDVLYMTSALPGIVFYGIARAIVCNSNSYIILCLIIIIYTLWMKVLSMLCQLVQDVATISTCHGHFQHYVSVSDGDIRISLFLIIFDHVAMWLNLASRTSIYFFAIWFWDQGDGPLSIQVQTTLRLCFSTKPTFKLTPQLQ